MPPSARINYIFGQDHTRSTQSASLFGGIVYHNLYTGISLEYSLSGQQLESHFTVAPGAPVVDNETAISRCILDAKS